jgi:hypothetical protein
MDNGGEVMRGEAMKFNVELTGESVWDETVQLWLTGAPTRVLRHVCSTPSRACLRRITLCVWAKLAHLPTVRYNGLTAGSPC